jgi:hypothetical protein
MQRRQSLRDGERLVLALELGGDHEFFGGAVPLDAEDVGAAADLAVFDIGLAGAGGFVDEGGVPFAAACALVAGFVGHGSIFQATGG